MIGLLGVGASSMWGCRGYQTAKVLSPNKPDMVGSHTAGAETYKPLVDTCVANLLARHGAPSPDGAPAPNAKRVCFIGVENKSIEELGDFKEQIYQTVDTQIVRSRSFQSIDRRFVEAGLRESRLRPDELFIPKNMRDFSQSMEQMNQPFDYCLYATLTSGTTHKNKDYQRDYVLTLELVDVRNGQYDKESAEISKAYNVSTAAKVKNLLPFN
jgi:hypothetical protein